MNLWGEPSWSKGRTAGHIFGREPSNDYFIKKKFLLSKWFQTRRFLWEFPIGPYVKLSSAVVAILNQTLLKWFLGGPLPKLCPAFQNTYQDGCHSRTIYSISINRFNISIQQNGIIKLEAPRSLYSSPGYNNNIISKYISSFFFFSFFYFVSSFFFAF
jgi:hypothetical protein